ncbi:hypothetical protein [Streptomyces mexicanus]|uniref:Bifunctional protein n=1 Tax=Streptomyces mexicanus TaxID=178566 RepID=A0A7X1I365_9ACTN|nr:hypothetical protein [Streptomyces mexicanus]MBC2866853.1 hypothetical protein [Streptomyces mexicanus]
MRHVPFFRWVLTLGFVLCACAVGLYAVGSNLPDARQIDLTVLDEKPDGSCRVRWFDPYQKRAREAPYRCDPGRSDLLKAPQYSGSDGYGWESGFLLTEGPERGNLEDLATEQDLGCADVFLLLGMPLIALGLIGGNLRALPRVVGVQSRLIRQASDLSQAATWAAQEYERAVSAVREAGRHDVLPRDAAGDPGSPLVTALWVLREAGPQARETAALGRKLASRLHRLLDDAAPAAGLRSMLQAGPAARSSAAQAAAELRLLLADAERDGLPERFAQTSVDLLRGQDADRAALAAATDFARDPAAYRHLLARLTQPAALP